MKLFNLTLGLVWLILIVPIENIYAAAPSPCKIQAVTFLGWQAQELSNDWVRLTIVPQLGGRLMQVVFSGHHYLFVNPALKGKYISPSEAAGRWINYGGDKIWPLPEGTQDEEHWSGASTALDDDPYSFSILSQAQECKVRLQGPNDSPTGLQYTRDISIGNDSPEISFHAVMKNFTGHSISWSVQSVSQYDLSDPADTHKFNTDFWAFAPINPQSSYLLGYHVRDGLADDPSFRTRDGMFRLNWKYIESEVWLDSTAGWIALVDGTTQYAIVEKNRYIPGGEYPSKASVIFYKNGPRIHLDAQGKAHLSADDPIKIPYYMEAELNSPMVKLRPGEAYALDTNWFPSRMSPELTTVKEAGLVGRPLTVRLVDGKVAVSGTFGVFYPGKLKAFLYGREGKAADEVLLTDVQPQTLVKLDQTIADHELVQRISVHLIDETGIDRGSLGEVTMEGMDDAN